MTTTQHPAHTTKPCNLAGATTICTRCGAVDDEQAGPCQIVVEDGIKPTLYLCQLNEQAQAAYLAAR
jgi:hypothetical protein